ncbi:MAG: single-stranded-DNA-specific exonuclease RecJ, partial [Bryobacterales bacterium]|nr:single-stranded-DNA-specific exonuclease RecJ [Bryobacterales bacterium]
VALRAEKLEEFRARLNEYAKQRLTPEDFRPHMEVDGELEFSEVNDASVDEVLSLAPFGAGNPYPQFVVRNVEVCDAPTIVKEKHLRVRLRQGARTLFLKAWNFAERAEMLIPGTRIDAVIYFEEDSYAKARGYPPWGVLLKDIRPAERAPASPE